MGKKTLITGASGGIGLSVANLLAQQGHELTLVARSGEKLEKIIDDLPGGNHDYLTADLSNVEDVTRIGAHLQETKYDTLINNAGVGIYGRFEELPLEDQVSMMHLNMDGLVKLSYAFLKGAEKGNALINVASVLGHTSYASASVYAGTKGFVLRFSESLWYEYRKRGIFVSAFNPGVTSSNFHDAAGGHTGDFPSIIMQTPDQVARELVSALRKRKKPSAVSGYMNRGMLFFYRFLSRKMIVSTMGGFSPILKD